MIDLIILCFGPGRAWRAGLSYSTVRDYVAKRRPQIAAEAGRALEAGCVSRAALSGCSRVTQE